jgi:hypothetical protein
MDSFITIFDEKELLLRLHQSDKIALTEIYNQYWNSLFYAAVYMLPDIIYQLNKRVSSPLCQQSTLQQACLRCSSNKHVLRFETLIESSLMKTAKLLNQCCNDFQSGMEETYSHKFSIT